MCPTEHTVDVVDGFADLAGFVPCTLSTAMRGFIHHVPNNIHFMVILNIAFDSAAELKRSLVKPISHSGKSEPDLSSR